MRFLFRSFFAFYSLIILGPHR